MRIHLVLLLGAIVGAAPGFAAAEKGTFVDEVTFVQYLDESTALEEVRNGNLDLYYFRIPSEQLESAESKAGLQVFDSTGGSYSILVNPAASEKFNPFSAREARFALNYMVDRNLIVNELMGGFGTPMISNYGPFDPDYISILEEIESFGFEYNPALAQEMISDSLKERGARLVDGVWHAQGGPIEVTVFIRSDDPVRESIGEILASRLEAAGFAVSRDYGDLNKAFVVVYGSDPADLKWSLYTEGWGGRSAFVRYDSVGLGQMYSPWFSSMPGFNDPSYWNYNNDRLDSLTQKLYAGNFSSAAERSELIRAATGEGVRESVRIFLAGKIDQYVANDGINGIVNDFGAGVPSRFTPINARSDTGSLTIGVKQIYQGSWNPVMGLSDSYSTHIWNTLYDPGIFKHPYTGENLPVRLEWEVETAGAGGKMDVPDDAIVWNPASQTWEKVPRDARSTSMVLFDLTFSNWHNGQPMDMNDVLYAIYFLKEWGSDPLEDDRTFDTEYTSRASQTARTLVGIVPVDEDTIEVYVDYWHFDESEIAYWASAWSAMPWEIYAAMEDIVMDGKTSFSRSGAVSKGTGWLSLLVPHDAAMIRESLESMKNSGEVPTPLKGMGARDGYHEERYDATIEWIDSKGHAVISNGPFYLEGYSPEARTIRLGAFVDESYPFKSGFWSRFEDVMFPRITSTDVPDVAYAGEEIAVPVSTENASALHYFLTDAEGVVVSSGTEDTKDGTVTIHISGEESEHLTPGANDLRLFATSDEVLRPEMQSISFLVAEPQAGGLPRILQEGMRGGMDRAQDYWIAPIAGLVAASAILAIAYTARVRRRG